MTQAIHAYRARDADALDAVDRRMDALKLQSVAADEIGTCSAQGALLRRIARAQVKLRHLDNPGATGLGDIPHFLYFDDLAKGRAGRLGTLTKEWPSDEACRDAPGHREILAQDSAEEEAERTAFQKMDKAWGDELAQGVDPEAFRQRLREAAKLLYANHLRANGFY